ncbi:mitochondrial cardiolipin hydrolase [Latimeria chalumnae]|uniref:Mitochondrial cardiolipin hydrolase n=1 Tax=Latimeria chalumnae TaxID=7897 RepID=H2ZTC7_LATCH|nr:PREDICTED: mitochondrial cardiolipin hydrolase [Latimeria chalumnae]|eukprot:XP_006014144.1 PREDICTED: mitochondrial cardiolipin hydrolase [Latimeria chalumnae]
MWVLPAMWKAPGLWALAFAFTLEGLVLLLRYCQGNRRKSLREVLFFPAPVACVNPLLYPLREGRRCGCRLPHDENSLSRLIRRLLSAQQSLELCIFAFSSPPLGRAVLLLHQRGVRVRVITDCNYMALTGSQIGHLRKAGIPVRHDQDTSYMHHKFAVVDKSILITGSLNWTTQAIQGNKENVIVTDEADFVQVFLLEFEKMWEEYDPAKYNFFLPNQ